MKTPIILTFFIFHSFFGVAQDEWTLARCIERANEQNLTLKQVSINAKIEEENLKQAKASRYPTLNGIATNNYNFGQRIDPFTNQFASTRVRSNTFAINTDIDLFRGFQIKNNIDRQKADLAASEKRIEQISNDLALSVASAYLQILLQQEIVALFENEVELSKKQSRLTANLVESGSLAKGELLNVQAQLSRNETNLINAQNQLKLNYLALRQLLQIPADEQFIINAPEIDVNKSSEIVESASFIYNQSVKNMPAIKVAELNLQSSEKSISVAEGSRSPVLRLGASYGTGYSGASREVIGTEFAGQVEIGTTANNVPVFANSFDNTTQVIPFSDQLRNNVNQTVGLSLSIPIFNNFSSRTSINTARLRYQNAGYDLEIAKMELENNIQSAHADAVAALANYHANEESVLASKQSLSYSKERFDAGLMNAVEFNQQQNDFIRATSQLLQAKYNYVFSLKVLDLYLGKPISLN